MKPNPSAFNQVWGTWYHPEENIQMGEITTPCFWMYMSKLKAQASRPKQRYFTENEAVSLSAGC